MTKHGQRLPRKLIAVEHTNVIESDIAGSVKDLVVSSTIDNHKLVTGMLDVEVDHGGVDARARWLSTVVLDFDDVQRN